MVRCPKCNSENDADSKFCDQCGTPLITPKSTTEQPVSKQPMGNIRFDAGVLSLFCPGLGHIYLELYARAAAFLGISIFIMLGSYFIGNIFAELFRGMGMSSYSLGVFNPYEFYKLGAWLVAVIWIWSFIDAITQADKIKQGIVKQSTLTGDMKTFVMVVFVVVGLLFACPTFLIFFNILNS